MTEYNAGDAKLRVIPDAKGFEDKLKAQLAAMRIPDVDVKVNLHIAQAKADMDRFRAVENDRTINQRVNPQLVNARAEMAKFRAEQRALNVDVPVNIDSSGAKAAGSRAGAAAAGGFAQEFGKVAGSVMDLGKVMGLTSLISLAPGAVTALASVAQAITQLSGAAFAVPGAIGGLVASFGTLAIGLSGIGEAYTALTEASSGSAANTQAITAAHQSLAHAVEDESHAQKDVAQARKDARHSLEDLNIELRGSAISEEQAVNDLKKARRDLAKGGFADALDRKDALLRVEEAEQRVIEVRQRGVELNEKVTDENAKGIEGSDRVVSAKEREVRAIEAIATAQNALAGAGGMDKVTESLAKLSPAAAEFAHALADAKKDWTDLTKVVSGNLLDGAAGSFTNFVDSVLPNLKAGLGSIATAWNLDFKTLLGTLGNDNSKGLLDRILGNTADAQTKFAAAIDPLVRGIGVLTAAGSDALPRLATAMGSVAERFATFIEAADKDGRLAGWINKGLDGFTSLGNIVINLAKSFTSITNAMGGPGLLASFEKLTSKWAAFLKSGEGQNKLQKFFAEGRAEWEKIKPILDDLPGILKGVFTAAAGAAQIFLPVLRTVADLLGKNPTLVTAIATAFISWKAIKPAVDIAMGALGIFNSGVIGIGTNFAGTRAKISEETDKINDKFDKAGNAGSKLNKFSSALGFLGGIGGPLSILTTAAVPLLIGALAKLDEQNERSAQKTDYLNQRQLNLEQTLDRVTGKITGQTLDSQIAAAQNYDPGGNGGGIQGISKGNPIEAAASLGIPKDVYGQGLIGNVDAQNKIRGILKSNNLGPEFAANKDLGQLAKSITTDTGGAITQDDLIAALLNEPGALDKYNKGLATAQARTHGDAAEGARIEKFYNLSAIAQRLSATGQASVLAGGAMNTLSQGIGGGDSTREQNETKYGRFRTTAAIPGVPVGTQVQSNDGNGYKVALPRGLSEEDLGRLREQGFDPQPNPDKTYTITIPQDGPVEKFEAGGSTRGGLAILHDDEHVLTKDDVGHMGGQAGVYAFRKALPHFDVGGDPKDNPDYNPFDFKTMASKMFGIPGLTSLGSGNDIVGKNPDDGRTTIGGYSIGLDPKLAANDPDAVKGAQDYVKGWGAKLFTDVGSTLYGGALSSLGLENSVLSSSNDWNQIGQKGLGLLTGSGANATGGGPTTIPVGPGGSESITIPGWGGAAGTGSIGSKGPENGLRTRTIALKHAIESRFPSVLSIGGYRPDPLPWHPDGRALDVMVSRLGNNDKPTPPGPRALGDAVYAWATGPAGVALGDYPSGTLWQVPDHYNHVHVALLDGGPYPPGGGPGGSTGVNGSALPVKHPASIPGSTDTATGLGANAAPPPTGGDSTIPGRVAWLLQQWAGYSPADRAKWVAAGLFTSEGRPILNGKTYDDGGWLKQGMSVVHNDTGAPEAVLTPEQGDNLKTIADNGNHLAPGIAAGLGGAGSIGSAVPGFGAILGGAAGGLGKIASGVANVAASFLVGSATIGDQGGASYARTFAPSRHGAERGGSTTNYNGGITTADPEALRRELDLRDAQHHQSLLAGHPSA